MTAALAHVTALRGRDTVRPLLAKNVLARILLALMLLAAGGGAAAGARDSRPAWASASARDTRPGPGELRDLFARINRRRVAIGCVALIWDARLAAVARRHSHDMARRRFFDHTNPDGADPFDRLRHAGIHFRAAAENIAAGQRTGAETFRAWMESSGHRRNLQNCVYTRVGLGLDHGYWTCVLVRLMSEREARSG